MKASKLAVLFGILASAVTASAYNKSMYPYELPSGKQGAALGCIEAKAGMKLEPGTWYTNFQVCGRERHPAGGDLEQRGVHPLLVHGLHVRPARLP